MGVDAFFPPSLTRIMIGFVCKKMRLTKTSGFSLKILLHRTLEDELSPQQTILNNEIIFSLSIFIHEIHEETST